MNDASFEVRLAALECTARRYRLAFFAAVVVVCGMGAVNAVQDAEFGVVKAKKFELVDSKGAAIGGFFVKSVEGGGETTSLMVTESTKKKAILLTPGREPLVVNNP